MHKRTSLHAFGRPALFLAAAVLVAARCVCGGEPARMPPAAEILPDGTVMFVEVAEWSEWSDDFSQTALAKIFAEPEVKQFLSGPFTQLAKLLHKAKTEAQPEPAVPAAAPAPAGEGGMEPADLIPSGPATFAVRYGPDDAAAKRPPAWALVLGYRDLAKIEPTKQLVLTLLDSLLKGKDIEKTFQIGEYLNTKLLLLKTTAPGGAPHVVAALATFKNRLIVSSDFEFTRQIMDGVAGTPAKKLADSATFKACALTGTEQLSAYVDIAGMQAATGVTPKPAPEAPMRFDSLLSLAGLAQAGAVAWLLKMDGPAFESRTAIFAKGERDGLLGTLDEQPLSADALKVIPAGAPFAAGFRLRAERLLPFIRAAVQTTQGQKAHDDFVDAEKELGPDFDKDAQAAFGNELVLASFAGLDATGPLGGLTTMAASLTVQDPQKADEVLTRLLTAIAAKMGAPGAAASMLKEIEYDGVKIRYLASGTSSVAPAFAVLPDRLIVAVDAPTLKSALRTLKQPETLATAKPFADSLAAMGGKMGAMFVYVDWAYTYKTAFSLSSTGLRLLAPTGLLRAAGIDLNLLPSTEAVTQHLFPGLSVAQMSPQGMVLISRSPVPSLEVLVPPVAAMSAVYASFRAEPKK